MKRQAAPSRAFLAGLALAAALGTAGWAQAQVYPPARVRVADRGLAQRQLLETLRGLVEADPNQLATRVDLMIAAYALVNFAEAGDTKLEGRVQAVEQAFEAYRQGAPGTVKPTEGALSESFRRELEKALSEIGKRPVIGEMQTRIGNLEREVQELRVQLEAQAARPGGAERGEKILAVGGMAATIASVLILAR